MPRRFQNLQSYPPELQNIPIAKSSKCVGCLRGRPQADRGAGAIAQFKMPGNEIGVQMRQEHVLDRQPILAGKRNVLVRVALRINNDGGTRLLIPNDVRRMRQAWQVELLEDQQTPSSLANFYFGCGTSRR